MLKEKTAFAQMSPKPSRRFRKSERPRQVLSILFDRRDYELIRIINAVCCSDQDLEYARRQYSGYFHPHGIKEMVESRSLRIAYAMVHLLTSLEVGRMDDRLSALRSLKDEVLGTAQGIMPKNTARALLQIMKELVRTRADTVRQLELAHDFRITAAGRPRFVRKQLRRYHLLEMPEEWNQITFDDHVHDVNTKGRKSSTHLIMDAWIKGIRRLKVVHYNYIEPRFAAELIEAADIMDIDIRIGIEFPALFRDRYIQLIWTPRGFPDAQAFLCFLEEPVVKDLMNRGREVSAFQQAYVMLLLEAFNREHRSRLNQKFGIDLQPIDTGEFMAFVGLGQKSTLHLEKFIHRKLLAALQAKADNLRSQLAAAGPSAEEDIRPWFEQVNRLDLEALAAGYLQPAQNPQIPDPADPRAGTDVPAQLKLSPLELLNRLTALQSGYRITLNLSDLTAADVLELLYDCNGMISRLEIFNLKDWAADKTGQIAAISRLQEAINAQNPIALKRMVLEIIRMVEDRPNADPPKDAQIAKLTDILHDIIGLLAAYKGKPLQARIGSDSTGRPLRGHGMGLAVIDTLPPRARRQIGKDVGIGREMIPIRMAVHKRHTLIPVGEADLRGHAFRRLCAALPGLRRIGHVRVEDWSLLEENTRMQARGNVVTLGGLQKEDTGQLCLEPPPVPTGRRFIPWAYLNSDLRNLLKVIVGFVPAFATFALTKQWWLLAYLGAFIWFGITGLRNILQSVLGGGGLRRSPLLRWNAYVSWDRIADSLLFTGFSVPLLDYLAKTVVLDRLCGINTSTHPVALYTFMALTNGIYLSSHNTFRGLPRGAVFWNFFRSVLSIPIAILLNHTAGILLSAGGIAGSDQVLQRWAAIISKAASDVVAGIIEGSADRLQNIEVRFRDYRQKLAALLNIYAQLELLFPESRILETLRSPRRFREKGHAEARDMEKVIAIHALDMLYFWMYQPRAQVALRQLVSAITAEERQVLVTSQSTLAQKREISQMFIDGVLGQDFARALSFYLSCYPGYLEALKPLDPD